MSVLLATSPLTALAEEPQEPTVTAVESETGADEAGNEQEEIKQKKTAAEENKSEENHSETVKEVKAAALEQKKESTGNGEAAEQSEEEYEFPTFTVRGKNYTLNSDTWAEGSVITLYMYKSEFKNCNTPEDYASIL